MRMSYGLAAMAGFVGLAVPALGLPLEGSAREFATPIVSRGGPQMISDRDRARKHRPVAEAAPRGLVPGGGDMGGYVVNRYGYGNYVAGPAGYGGYPAGSADAQIWKQRQEWKCQAVPESC